MSQKKDQDKPEAEAPKDAPPTEEPTATATGDAGQGEVQARTDAQQEQGFVGSAPPDPGHTVAVKTKGLTSDE